MHDTADCFPKIIDGYSLFHVITLVFTRVNYSFAAAYGKKYNAYCI